MVLAAATVCYTLLLQRYGWMDRAFELDFGTEAFLSESYTTRP